jgi:hypothetical protein
MSDIIETTEHQDCHGQVEFRLPDRPRRLCHRGQRVGEARGYRLQRRAHQAKGENNQGAA